MRNLIPKIRGKRSPQNPHLPGAAGMPLGQRFYLFLTVLLLTIFLGVIAILQLTGTFTAGLAEKVRYFENELAHASNKIAEQYGQISLQTVELAEKLSGNIEQRTSRMGLSLAHLAEHPDLLEEIISGVCDEALFSLLLSKSSGVFLILDATINPALEDAANSRAGLYIKNMEPNIVSASSPNIITLRGFPRISREKSLPLHAQWQMEFNISEAPYYHCPVEAARAHPHLPVSRLYYWSDPLRLPGTSEEVMLCAAPLIDSGGCVFGVCGLEISAMLFKLSHMPNNSIYKRLFGMLSPLTEDRIEPGRSFFAGGYFAKMISSEESALQIARQRHHFYTYKQGRDGKFMGLHSAIQLYPQGSVFSHQQWAVAVMVPEKDLMASVTRLNLIRFFSLMLLVIAGVLISFNLSNRFLVKPLSRGLAMIKSPELGAVSRTRIPEIDNLIDYLALHDQELAEKARRENLSFDTLDRFLERMAELTPAERAVFKYYGEGCTAQEIAAKLHLSINTIKTHSKHIYMKLEITSRKEIALYVTLLQEIGIEIG